MKYGSKIGGEGSRRAWLDMGRNDDHEKEGQEEED